jgi:SAM-dependent methyltransferase
VRSNPYAGVDPRVVDTARPLLSNADEYHRSHEARLVRTLELIYDADPKGRLLELGTSGFLPIACEELLPNLEIVVTHFDLSNESRWPTKFSIADRSRMVMAYCVDLEYTALPSDDDTFDMVVCCEVLEHMEIDPMAMLAEVHRVLKPGGKLLLTTPNVISSRGLWKISQGLAPWFYMQYHKDRSYHRHNIEYDAKTLGKLLTYAGFDCKLWSEDLFEDGMPDVVRRAAAAGFDISNVGDNLIALCTKAHPIIDRHPRFLYD